MGALFVFFLIYGIINLCRDAHIHNTPVLGSKKDIITTHPERYRNYLEVIAKQVRNLDSKQGRNPAKQDFKNKRNGSRCRRTLISPVAFI